MYVYFGLLCDAPDGTKCKIGILAMSGCIHFWASTYIRALFEAKSNLLIVDVLDFFPCHLLYIIIM